MVDRVYDIAITDETL